MPDLVSLVLDDPDKVEQILESWLEVGVSGVTIWHSTGLARELNRRRSRDDLPLIPSLQSLFHTREEPHRTLWAIVPNGFDMQALVTATEKITGSLDGPDSGILFVIPIARVWGLNRG